jgi:hypothetical protein
MGELRTWKQLAFGIRNNTIVWNNIDCHMIRYFHSFIHPYKYLIPTILAILYLHFCEINY